MKRLFLTEKPYSTTLIKVKATLLDRICFENTLFVL